MKFFETKYRVVIDKYLGYEAQFKYWWMPIYFQIGGCNTFPDMESAKSLCKRHLKPKVVWQSSESELDKS